MPGGFENSAMKSSFSLSSLQPSSVNLESPQHATLKDRPYNSLGKKCRKDSEVEMWWRTWGSREDNRDEFWASLKNNYQYLMNNNLIESCREAGNDLLDVCSGFGSPTHNWSFDQFKHQFVELDSWLNSIQDEYMKGDSITDRNIRLNHMEELLRKSYKRKVFHNQGGRLVARFPELKEEVAWRILYLNNKWEKLEQIVTPRKRLLADRHDVSLDIEKELNCFRRWVKQTDKRLASINFQTQWSSQELAEKTKDHEVLQSDVESHGKIIRKLVRVCERFSWADSQVEGAVVTSFVRGRRLEASQAVRFARSLERHWQLLYLRSLEWLCHIEEVNNRLLNSSPQSGKLQESDGEPASKHPRLSNQQTHQWLQQTQQPDDYNREEVTLMDCGLDDDIMVGSQMEIDQQTERNEILETLTAPIKCLSGDNINEKMKTDSIIQPRRQSLPMDVSRKLFHDDSSKFTQSERLGPHCAVLYYRHKDTDSEQDVGNVSDKMGKRSIDESSEDEWVYTYGADNTEQEAGNNGSSSESRSVAHTVESFKPSVQQNDCEMVRTTKKEDIQRLINQAEELVREEVSSSPRKIQARLFADKLRFNDSKGKISRVKEWLSVQEQDPDDKAIVDSCDASCECTTEDDDLERHSSDDLNTSSVATCHHSAEAIESGDLDATLVPEKSFPSPALPNMSEHTKVIMRQKRKDGPQIRPWSVSGMSQLGASASSRLSHFSISESALHQLAQNSTPSSKMESSVQGTLSSSTVEETTVQAQDGSGGGYSSNSLRRRKVKLRKRNLGRKSESGSDGVLAMEPGSPLKNGPSRQPISGTETEEETEEANKARLVRKKLLNVPAFRLGPSLGAVTVFKTEKVVSADSSFSEQAWDNYQEKYMSEAYSEEAADPEAARRLLDFGDDYRNFLDSQSDCASSFGRPFYRRRQPTGDSCLLDSDSDIEDVCKLFDQSHSQYVYLEQVFTRQLSKASPQLILASDFADIIARCRENVHCLRVLLESVSKMNDNLLPPQGCQEIRLLIDRWETLEGRAENLQRMRTLQREMSAFRDELTELSNRVNSLKQDLNDQDQLERRIQQIKVELARLRDQKSQLLQVNVAVHRFLTDTGHAAGEYLKEDVNDLYRIWDETYRRANQQLSSYEQLSAAWQQFELHLTELKVALRGDHETLRMLDSALQGGSVSPDVATSVRNVAKVLSEKQEMLCEGPMVLNDSTSVILTTQGVSTMEGSGSLSDSGISDSGSEQELSEREKRLAALRRLARRLEALLAPGSQVITDLARSIGQTELELRELQQTCRELIVKTAVCAEAKVARSALTSDIPPHCTVPSASCQRSRRKKANSKRTFLGVGDPDDPDPGKPHSWLWRVMRAALPFQMAVMALFCVAYLLEPQCCENINNFTFSLTPQLRYPDGPPPI